MHASHEDISIRAVAEAGIQIFTHAGAKRSQRSGSSAYAANAESIFSDADAPHDSPPVRGGIASTGPRAEAYALTMPSRIEARDATAHECP